jgi:hypothetical protein
VSKINEAAQTKALALNPQDQLQTSTLFKAVDKGDQTNGDHPERQKDQKDSSAALNLLRRILRRRRRVVKARRQRNAASSDSIMPADEPDEAIMIDEQPGSRRGIRNDRSPDEELLEKRLRLSRDEATEEEAMELISPMAGANNVKDSALLVNLDQVGGNSDEARPGTDEQFIYATQTNSPRQLSRHSSILRSSSAPSTVHHTSMPSTPKRVTFEPSNNYEASPVLLDKNGVTCHGDDEDAHPADGHQRESTDGDELDRKNGSRDLWEAILDAESAAFKISKELKSSDILLMAIEQLTADGRS